MNDESQENEKFKYKLLLRGSKYFGDKLAVLKTNCKKIINRPKLMLVKVDLEAIRKDLSIWFAEAVVEGFVMNFIVWALIGWKFNLLTMLAWGFAVKQSLSIYWRLRKNGSLTTISNRDK